uniref:peptidylprolyl isomerase n=1 Tax=Helicotheca tamesis TaxID=374047 RepID=A0A7S2I8Q8_9STRA|mmetsp:Transcript_6911/g.9308  ORF Transcript_6911/g.9308 Transcript_6911/m.9308 type:complete len:296 (+) Transcript_6911:213-1100(+)|eukprot:CAMPEP_0185730940 /NCGR_PEP_ID=MMETSP1171-20130828/11463_1 /TAXON_ID=374046 /ORGANISM="Helicotheca tamensis, Strain CCMP826" /LENGTH=295 /DNA_ID=CAMNT_0028400091 /DNA_START=165 /DNA_END=1052 /DNA_ORIENTATION=+
MMTTSTTFLYTLLLATTMATTTMAFVVPTTQKQQQFQIKSTTKLYSSLAIEGLTKKTTKEGNGPPLERGQVASVKYSCYLPGTETKPFSKSDKQRMIVGDGQMIEGWELALLSMNVGERATIRISDPNKFGYGEAGVPPIVPPNAPIEMDMEILGAEERLEMGAFANNEPLTPRTPKAIRAAYEARKEAKIQDAIENPPAEGLQAWIEKFNSFYFFGFFEGETGQQAPWFLRPSITFPLAFAVVGAAFYISLKFGAISERGAQVTDELDELIVLGGAMRDALMMAFLDVSNQITV